MRKLCVICLFLTVLFAFSVNAKVCFLPGVFAGDGCIEGEVSVGCSGFERTSPCPSNYSQETCSDNGRTYYRCTCKSNNIPMPDSRYRCLGSYDSSCGCAAADTVCNTSIYSYESCDAYAGTVANSDFCADPSTGKRHYKSCDCPESIYPYDCKETGLKESRLAQKCKDSSGKTAYSYCDCIDSWTTEPCSENSSGCNTLLDDAYRGGNMGYCYSCGPATCANAQEKNLTAVFCSVTPTTNTNCYSLGYTTLDNGTGLCADGTEGVKCIFDSKYMFCEGQLSGDNISGCTYVDKAACEATNIHSFCDIDYGYDMEPDYDSDMDSDYDADADYDSDMDSDYDADADYDSDMDSDYDYDYEYGQCYVPMGCKSGYYSNRSACDSLIGTTSNATIVNADANGCGECQYPVSDCSDLGVNYKNESEIVGMTCSNSARVNLSGTYKNCYWGCEDEISGCALGDVYYSDGSCGSVDEYDSSKIAIGVVFALSAEKGGMPYTTAEAEAEGFRAEHGRVINLRNLTSDSTTYAFDPENPYDNSDKSLYFGLYGGTDVSGLTNYESAALMLTGFQNDDIELYSGKENTAKFASATPAYSSCTNGSYTVGTANYNQYCASTAAKAAISFYPPEVSSSDAIAGAGNWYLPAIGELALLYGIDVSKMTSGTSTSGATGTTKTIVNNTLTALASQKVDAAMLTDGYYWSSVECASNTSWLLVFSNGYRTYYSRRSSGYFRVALEF
ncbi:MAG: DUF1566 domain-containing protein [Alphaproteobacteria bacterium]|nr:DUF1566 domain-containing protein [Alphaproteobacteria bacterium]